MNCLLKVLYSASLLGAFMMDSGRMNNEAGYQDQNSNHNGELAYEMNTAPVPQEERFYRTPSGREIYSPDPNQPPQFHQGTYPYPPTDYDNKNRRWMTKTGKTDWETQWAVEDQVNSRPGQFQHHQMSDNGIAQQIRLVIRHDPLLETIAKNVEVEVKDGNVTLKGHIHTQEEKSKIDYIAQSIDGVNRVDNKLTVENDKHDLYLPDSDK